MSATKLMLVGWDAADWRMAGPLAAAGQLPQLRNLVEHGVSGPLRSQPPYLSPMLWNTIATGKNPAEHGIHGFTEANPSSGAIQPASSRSRRCKALWDILSQEGIRSTVVGWFASHPAESIKGTFVSDAFARLQKDGRPGALAQGAVASAELADRLAGLRVGPDQVDPALLRFFLPRLEEIDLRRDARPRRLLERLAELYTYHNTAVALLDHDQSSFLGVYYHFIDWICHDFIVYAPPQRPDVADRDFALYGGVVDAAYRLQDILLRDLLREAGAGWNVVVVSDHGFQSGATRPRQTPGVTAGPAAWHREEGLIAMAGPAFAAGVRLAGTTLYDIVPTILESFGLPAGEDMPGRVLTDALSQPISRSRIPSWEERGPRRARRTEADLSPAEATLLLKQFEDLGYIATAADPFETAASLNRRENAWNLGIALMDDGRHEEALPALEEAFFCHPEEGQIAVSLARCQAMLGLIEESRATARVLEDFGPDNILARRQFVELAQLWGAPEEALEHLEVVARAGGADPGLEIQRGQLLLLLERFPEAVVHFRRLAAETPSLLAEIGLCRALVRSGEGVEAEHRLRPLLEQDPANALAWFSLGQALEQRDAMAEAKEAFDRALQLRPDFSSAKGKSILLDVTLASAAGEISPHLLGHFDFGEDGGAKARKAADARLADLRRGSVARLQSWQSAREREREEVGPIGLFFVPDLRQPPVIVVSGLPRSGTSLMMQMLERGGVPIQTDGLRQADASNPRGYFEWEDVKSLRAHPERLLTCGGKAVKVVSLQLGGLPPKLPMKVLWMDRPLEDVHRSQARMRQVEAGGETDPKKAALSLDILQKHRDASIELLRARMAASASTVEILTVPYRLCLENPRAVSAQLSRFLGSLFPDPESAPSAVDPSLCHYASPRTSSADARSSHS